MKKSISLTVQAVYVLITALQLIFVPNMLLGMFGFEPTSEVWIKVLGVVLIAFVLVYFGVIQYGNKDLIRITIYSRLIVVVGFILLVATGQAATPLILFAGIDFATAIWTWFELKSA
jgi:hypothetical protein